MKSFRSMRDNARILHQTTINRTSNELERRRETSTDAPYNIVDVKMVRKRKSNERHDLKYGDDDFCILLKLVRVGEGNDFFFKSFLRKQRKAETSQLPTQA